MCFSLSSTALLPGVGMAQPRETLPIPLGLGVSPQKPGIATWPQVQRALRLGKGSGLPCTGLKHTSWLALWLQGLVSLAHPFHLLPSLPSSSSTSHLKSRARAGQVEVVLAEGVLPANPPPALSPWVGLEGLRNDVVPGERA